MHDLVIIGRIVTPTGILDDGWVAIDAAHISALGTGAAPESLRRHDASGRFVMPGVIDGQTHAGSQIGFPGLEVTTRSAIAGGVTTIVDMPYDEPAPVTNAALFAEKVAAVRRFAYCDVALYATVPPVPSLTDIEALVAAGACAFKISSFENHPTRFPRITNDNALMLLSALAATDLPVGLHNEDADIVRRATAAHLEAGLTGPEFHDPSRPPVAELVATANFLELGADAGAHAHIVHISTPRGFDLVRQYRERGFRATAEMCIHYLHFDAATDMQRLGALMKVNPPIRGGVREALWALLESGAVDFVSSDHSPWPLARKQDPSIFKNAAGIPGLETLLPAFCTGLAARRGSLEKSVSEGALYLSERPARFFGLWPRKGSLTPGAEADVVVLDDAPYRHDAREAQDGVGWSPFDGETFVTRAAATFVRGQHVWDGSDILGRPGDGRFVARGS